ncbi:MAG: ATP-binding cassette domain-containing protein [Synechococcales cyanobacterium RU_4_20]|nr:ATP-binding cassette domain-containing protein [Synechococcales cyanobacterium RU_4_20]NJR68877.1 ATP-binding cassette domain-containing protein [Synechococcales cyanobacterium CRU_2_2]
MSIFTLQSVSKDFGIKPILNEVSFSLGPTDKIGLIGTNGSGKSTLLKIIAGLEPVDGGARLVNPAVRIVYLPQEPDLDESRTVLEQVFADSGERMELVREYEDVSHRIAAGTDSSDALLNQLSRLTERMDAIGAWDLEAKAKIVLTQLGIEDFEARIGSLSGGYRKRIALATALLAEPEVLLMDEPTNHLDALSVEWLQTYLNRYPGALLLITHDRYFLDRVTTRILELDRGDLSSFNGNYSYYLQKKTEQEDSAASTQQKHKGVLRRELEWLSRGAKARSTKQRARIQRIEAMQEKEFKKDLGKVEISTIGRRIGKKVIEAENVTKGYGDRILINQFTHAFTPEDRIGIIGSNGAGKSTLMDMITGRLEPDSGKIELGATIHIGYFDQYSNELLEAADENQRVIDYIKETAELVKTSDGSVITASQMLERFLFPPEQQYAPLAKLSGGERRRLFLLRVLMGAPNVLILDEPTNDLDVQTLSVLEEYLEEFNGCVITVSHDRYFLDRVVETIFALEAGGNIRQYPGNYSVYLDYKKEQDAAAKAAEKTQAEKKQAEQKAEQNQAQNSTSPSAAKAPSAARARRMSYKEKRELETLETQIPVLEAEKEQLEKTLYQNAPSDFEALEKLSARLGELTQAIETGTERWLELSELSET